MTLQRFETNARMSQMVIHNETIYLAGQVGDPSGDIAEQTRSMLAKVDRLLAEAGSDKTKILQATIWVASMGDFAKMNEVWDSWVPEGQAPGRACGEARLATPEYKVEIIIIAAK
ncbi:MAG: enamine deaminase RidA (YjgF/YER057c/UK114 family) [Polaribacter sp.]|jgi:enamine deaminase RidA (YjgF/YER057c/UK114 family)